MSTRPRRGAPAPTLIDAHVTRRDGSEEMRITLEPYRGFQYVNVRKWWKDPAGEWRPGKGATIRVELLPWLRHAIEKAEASALAAGLLDEESYQSCGLELPAELLGADPA